MNELRIGGMIAALIGTVFFLVERNYKDAFTTLLIALLFVQ